MTGAPEGSFCLSVYDSRSFGWFDMKTFEKFFFFLIFLKSSEKLNGPKVIIRENLRCDFSPKIIETCVEKDIRFINVCFQYHSLDHGGTI